MSEYVGSVGGERKLVLGPDGCETADDVVFGKKRKVNGGDVVRAAVAFEQFVTDFVPEGVEPREMMKAIRAVYANEGGVDFADLDLVRRNVRALFDGALNLVRKAVAVDGVDLGSRIDVVEELVHEVGLKVLGNIDKLNAALFQQICNFVSGLDAENFPDPNGYAERPWVSELSSLFRSAGLPEHFLDAEFLKGLMGSLRFFDANGETRSASSKRTVRKDSLKKALLDHAGLSGK